MMFYPSTALNPFSGISGKQQKNSQRVAVLWTAERSRVQDFRHRGALAG
jgi:hypothetical protein